MLPRPSRRSFISRTPRHDRAAAIIAAAAVAVPASITAAQTNVALARPVTLVSGSVNGAALSTITDGLFLPRGQQWQTDTVWWNGLAPTIEIDLGGIFLVDSAIAQVDDNDGYLLQYHDIQTDTFVTLWDIPNYDNAGSGMQTRPNPADDTERFFFPGGPISTDRIRIAAASGDESYSVSEVQLFAVPTPASAALLALTALSAARRRRPATTQ